MISRKPVLLAEDDANDVLLLRLAFETVGLADALAVVRNGQQTIDYLQGAGPYHDREKYPRPKLLLLDLNMPGVDGFEVLAWRNTRKDLLSLPILVLSSSNLHSDISRAMDLGAAGYCVKPGDFRYLREVARQLRDQWLAELDPGRTSLTPLIRATRYTNTAENHLSNSCSR